MKKLLLLTPILLSACFLDQEAQDTECAKARILHSEKTKQALSEFNIPADITTAVTGIDEKKGDPNCARVDALHRVIENTNK